MSISQTFFRNASATITDVVYGIQITESSNRFIAIADEVDRWASVAALPGKFLVDVIPARALSMFAKFEFRLIFSLTVRYIPNGSLVAGFIRSRRTSAPLLRSCAMSQCGRWREPWCVSCLIHFRA